MGEFFGSIYCIMGSSDAGNKPESIQDVEIGHAAKNSKLPDRGCNISWLCLFYLQKENHKENRRGI